jgi:ubiquinone/menaquinone biosynthesis C-methylase UbiE
MDAHVKLFDGIAPWYSLFFSLQRRMFRSAVARNARRAGMVPGDTVLDIGCGTGALVSVLSEAGFKAEGVDAAPNMVASARGAGVECSIADIGGGLGHEDQSFDFVVASFVAHGLQRPMREKLYAEAKRIARKAAIFHDYRGRQGFFMELIERMEGGDYLGFIASAEEELSAYFGDLEIIDIPPSTAWYVCRTEQR